MSLDPDHLKDLQKSALNDETIRMMGAYSAQPTARENGDPKNV